MAHPNTVTCKFGANFEYDAAVRRQHWRSYRNNLGKTYTVNVPALPIEYDVTKKGTADLANQSITWTVNISATQGATAVDLAGYQFFDDLQTVGTYIPSSFQVDGVDATPNTADNALGYVVPDGSTSRNTTTIKTKISDCRLLCHFEQKVNNTAQLLDSESTTVDEDSLS